MMRRTCFIALSVMVFGTMLGCGNGPCIDGVEGDRIADGTSTAIQLHNDSLSFVHLIGSRETADLCNRVVDGASRFIFVAEGRISYSVRAVSDGVSLGEITCALPEEQEVRFNGVNLVCINTNG